ncbi:YkvA family protein [Streptomyces sp. NPDC058657]|uniref:YkvA family protein n=1 Tax=unclassified Streptomyces TaxID=2593676 RepID=UPI0036607AC5
MSDGMTILLIVVGVLALATIVGAVVVLVKMVKARKLLTDAGIPVENKFVFWGALIYLLSPVDLIPDPVYLDDIGIMLLVLQSLQTAAEKAGVRPGRRDRTLERQPDEWPEKQLRK